MLKQSKPPEFRPNHNEVVMLAAFALETSWPEFATTPFYAAVEFAQTVADAATDIASGSATSDEAGTLLKKHERIVLDDDWVPEFVDAVLDVAEQIRPESTNQVDDDDTRKEP